MPAKTAASAANPAETPDGTVAPAADNLEGLKVERRSGDPRTLRRQETNARFMTAQQMEQLVANIRRDGVLTSLPLTYQPPEGPEEILSGHHRVEAAIQAGLAQIDWLCIVTPLTEARKTAIQLSHNAIVGQDDPATLAQMYMGLDLEEREYSGLDDDVLKAMEGVELTGLNVGLKYQEMHLFFLPEDEAVVAEALKDLTKAAKKAQAYVARFDDYEEFFNTVVAVKTSQKAFNSATAVRLLVDLAKERLAQIEAEAAAPKSEPTDA